MKQNKLKIAKCGKIGLTNIGKGEHHCKKIETLQTHVDSIDMFATISRLRLQADIQDEQDQEKVFLIILSLLWT